MPANTAYRVEHVTVRTDLRTTEPHRDAADHCLTVYDEGCIVGQPLAGGPPLTALTAVAEDEL